MLDSETAAPVQRRRRSLVEAEASAPVAKPVPEATPAPKGLVFECKVTKEVLANALSRVTGVVEQRNTIPILAHVKIDFAPGSLTITGTDLNACAVEKVEAIVAGPPSSVAVPAHKLHDIVGAFPKGAEVKISLEAKEGGMAQSPVGTQRLQLAEA